MYQNFTYGAVIDLIHSTAPLVLDRNKAGDITQKGRSDFATAVDYEVQTYMQMKLRDLYPDIQFLAEENHAQNVDPTRPYWVLDPIDGTTNLIHDCQQSCVALALWDGTQLVFGCCYNPFRDETFAAELGKGAYLNGRPIHVSGETDMEKALVIVGTSPYEREKTGCSTSSSAFSAAAPTSAGWAARSWTSAPWPAAGRTAMWSITSSPGTTPPAA